ncbi:MAG TPA: porin [Ohtaekwangia sp.]|nr:porin [Ohtaekwangia sp.]
MVPAKTRIQLTLIAVFTGCSPVFAQDITKNSFGNGISIVAADSSFSVNAGVRFQTLYQITTDLDSDAYEDNLQIRRSRIKLDGFVYNPKLQYKIELALANSDTNVGSVPQSGNTSSIVLDAYIKYNFTGNWTLWFGQAKLPGNRERVISSQALQFVDRSNLNSRFNLDRDVGVQLHYKTNKFNFITALSMGEGRNIVVENAGGYGYTVRGEYLPFGKFKEKGDYVGADLSREEDPKLSLGVTYDYNDRASKERGQLGDFLGVQRDLETIFADAHFKYRGFSSLIEFVYKKSPDGPLIKDSENNVTAAFYTGRGFSAQAGYLFKNNFELAGRYTIVTPEKITLRNENTQYTVGVSKYFVGHNLKVQSDVSFITEATQSDALMYRLQLEVAL